MPRIDLPVSLGIATFVLAAVLGDRAWCEPAPGAVPVAQPKARYEALRAHSPFALATAVAATPAPPAGFAANWYVTGVARIGDAEFVTIKSRDLSAAFSLYSGESKKAEEVALVSVNWSDVVGKSTVILRKGTETAKLEFNEAEVHAAPQATAGAAGAAGGKPPPNGAAAHAATPGIPGGGAAATLAGVPKGPGNLPAPMTKPMAAPVPHRRVPPIQPPQ